MLKPAQDPVTGVINAEMLSHQVSLAQRLVTEKPDSALAALRQMLKESEEEPAA
jgi:flagellar M-ring protein FliF